MSKKLTREKVIDAALALFYQKGFQGTSVRDIADGADVNVSLISYYFKNKQGLLEFAVTNYYEEYIEIMENYIAENQNMDSELRCRGLIEQILEYRIENYQITSFIHREIQLNTIFVKEMMVTYLAKENYLLKAAFIDVIPHYKNQMKDLLFIQLKGMLISPFIYKEEWKNKVLDQHDRNKFMQHYITTIEKWLAYLHNGIQ